MDIKDFRKIVLDSPTKDKLRSLKVVLNYPHLNSSISLEGVESIYKFIYNQVFGWNEIENLPRYFRESKSHFENLKSQIIKLTDFFNENNLNQFDRSWNLLLSSIKNDKTANDFFVFLYDSPETDFILKVHKQNPNVTQGAIDFLTNSSININNSKDYFVGVLFGYEFKNQSNSDLLSRRTSEKTSLSQIRTKYNEYIVEAESQLNSNLSDAKENLTNHFETVNKLKEEKEKNIDAWFNGVQKGFDEFFKKSNQSIKDNEDLYREKLRLEAPAKYWKDRADKLKAESDNQLDLLIRISLFGSSMLFIILLAIGNNYYSNVFSDTLKGIKWSLILITIISLLVFIIRILAKLYLSSLHLYRDAEEREQLTHFYLALKKDTTIEPEERQLILQSLFSRADTGLLKEDSSPTMPTSIIDKFAGNK